MFVAVTQTVTAAAVATADNDLISAAACCIFHEMLATSRRIAAHKYICALHFRQIVYFCSVIYTNYVALSLC